MMATILGIWVAGGVGSSQEVAGGIMRGVERPLLEEAGIEISTIATEGARKRAPSKATLGARKCFRSVWSRTEASTTTLK